MSRARRCTRAQWPMARLRRHARCAPTKRDESVSTSQPRREQPAERLALRGNRAAGGAVLLALDSRRLFRRDSAAKAELAGGCELTSSAARRRSFG